MGMVVLNRFLRLIEDFPLLDRLPYLFTHTLREKSLLQTFLKCIDALRKSNSVFSYLYLSNSIFIYIYVYI